MNPGTKVYSCRYGAGIIIRAHTSDPSVYLVQFANLFRTWQGFSLLEVRS